MINGLFKVFMGIVILVVCGCIAIFIYVASWYSGDWSDHGNSSESTSVPASATSVDTADTIQAADGGEKDLGVRVLNYTDDNLDNVYVNGDWSGGMGKHLGGTPTLGDAGVPQKWRRDFKLHIAWQNDTMINKDQKSQVDRLVSIEPYKESDGGSLWVAFLPGDVIKLYVSGNYPGNPEFSAKIAMPFIQCWKDGFKGCPEAGRPDNQADQPQSEMHAESS